MGMMQPSTTSSGFFRSISISAIDVASSALETILDLVESDKSRSVETKHASQSKDVNTSGKIMIFGNSKFISTNEGAFRRTDRAQLMK